MVVVIQYSRNFPSLLPALVSLSNPESISNSLLRLNNHFSLYTFLGMKCCLRLWRSIVKYFLYFLSFCDCVFDFGTVHQIARTISVQQLPKLFGTHKPVTFIKRILKILNTKEPNYKSNMKNLRIMSCWNLEFLSILK